MQPTHNFNFLRKKRCHSQTYDFIKHNYKFHQNKHIQFSKLELFLIFVGFLSRCVQTGIDFEHRELNFDYNINSTIGKDV